jgi:mRNA-degrading endonuclease RelE of RelBE toxin-antitoxin system
MVVAIVDKTDEFVRIIKKIKDNLLKEKVTKQIEKIVNDPEVGKPMRFGRKGTREVYVPPFRLSYAYIKEENKIIFLDLYHKDEQ